MSTQSEKFPPWRPNNNYVLDADTGEWVPETQPGGGGGGGGPVQITDGADTSTKATVSDFTDSNPLNVVLTDLSGDPYVASSGGGGAATIADGADVAEGSTTDAAVTGDNTGTVSAKLRGLSKIFADVWDSVNHRLNVFIANTTLAVTQSGSWVLSAGSAIIGKVGIDQTTPGTTNKVSIGTDGTVAINAALPAGANVIGHVITDATSTTSVTQPTAASLNATIVGTGTFLVQAAQSGTWSITTVRDVAAAETLSNVASSASNVTLLASNSGRKGAVFFNDSTQSCFVKFGTTASATSYTYQVFPSQTLELPVPIYQGQIDGIWASANGAMRVTETT